MGLLVRLRAVRFLLARAASGAASSGSGPPARGRGRRLWRGITWLGRLINRWWWNPSPAAVLLWMLFCIPFGLVYAARAGHQPGGKTTVRGAIGATVLVVAIAPLVILGWRRMIHDLFIDPFRAWKLRRAIGRTGHFGDDRFRERRR